MSNVELYLMWNTYSSIKKGIAIKSTIGHLIDALDSNDNRCIYVSDVKYIDYTQESTFTKAGGFANDLARYFCKRDYFQQEKELRLVYYDFKANLNDNMKGVNFKISLNTLIDEIWIAPKAEEWYETLINDELKLHKIKKKVKRSLL